MLITKARICNLIIRKPVASKDFATSNLSSLSEYPSATTICCIIPFSSYRNTVSCLCRMSCLKSDNSIIVFYQLILINKLSFFTPKNPSSKSYYSYKNPCFASSCTKEPYHMLLSTVPQYHSPMNYKIPYFSFQAQKPLYSSLQ